MAPELKSKLLTRVSDAAGRREDDGGDDARDGDGDGDGVGDGRARDRTFRCASVAAYRERVEQDGRGRRVSAKADDADDRRA